MASLQSCATKVYLLREIWSALAIKVQSMTDWSLYEIFSDCANCSFGQFILKFLSVFIIDFIKRHVYVVGKCVPTPAILAGSLPFGLKHSALQPVRCSLNLAADKAGCLCCETATDTS